MPADTLLTSDDSDHHWTFYALFFQSYKKGLLRVKLSKEDRRSMDFIQKSCNAVVSFCYFILFDKHPSLSATLCRNLPMTLLRQTSWNIHCSHCTHTHTHILLFTFPYFLLIFRSMHFHSLTFPTDNCSLIICRPLTPDYLSHFPLAFSLSPVQKKQNKKDF